MEKVSIITINLNNKDGLERTIQSVLDQTVFNNIEYIIIDGASTDGSTDVIKKYAPSIAYSVSENDNGIYDAMNKGILKATGEYILFLNSGDYFLRKNSIETLINANTDNYDFIYGDIVLNSGSKTVIQKYPNTLSCLYFNHSSLPHPATLIKSSLFQDNLYDDSFKIAGDWFFFYQEIIFKGKTYHHVSEPITVFYTDGISSTHPQETKLERIQGLKKCGKLVPNKVYVGLTSWTGRIKTVHHTIKTLLKQTRVPDCIYLTLASEEFPDKQLPEELTSLISDHFQIVWVKHNIKTMKKILPILPLLNDEDIIINSDDDLLYPEDFIERRLVDWVVYGMRTAISSQPNYKQYGTYFSGCASLWQKKMFKGVEIFANKEVLFTFEDDWLYTFLCLLNKYPIKLATKYHIKDFKFFSQENSALSQKLYNTARTKKVMCKRVQELFGMSIEDFTASTKYINWNATTSGKCACRLMGRLGNQLFEIAAAKTYAQQHNKTFTGAWMYEKPNWLQERDTPSDYIKETVLRNVPFITTDDILQDNYYIYPKIGEENVYLNQDFEIPFHTNICLSDFFQNPQFIDKKVAYDLFAPYNSIIQEIHDLYGDLSDYVSINIRRGDYLQPNLQKLGFKIWEKEDIEDVINTYFPNDKIIFTSDDIEWCKQNFKGKKYKFADKSCKSKIEMDLYLPTQCGKGNVISSSTFSWWGAYLNQSSNKTVIAPYPWFSNNFLNGFNQIIPDEWIKYEKPQKS